MRLKTWFFILLSLGFVFLLLITLYQNNLWSQSKKSVIKTTLPQIQSEESALQQISFENKNYYYSFFSAAPSKLKLIINSNKLSSDELITKNSCQKAVNGGFYDANFNPLGLIVIDGKTINIKSESNLLNSFLAITKNLTPQIVSNNNEIGEKTNYLLLLQTGPQLFNQGQTENLQIQNDKFSRRSVAIISKQKSLGFLVIFEKENRFSGPKLAELPQILSLIAEKEAWSIESATNLDGGSTSTFKNKDLHLMEFKTVGEVICVK